MDGRTDSILDCLNNQTLIFELFNCISGGDDDPDTTLESPGTVFLV